MYSVYVPNANMFKRFQCDAFSDFSNCKYNVKNDNNYIAFQYAPSRDVKVKIKLQNQIEKN